MKIKTKKKQGLEIDTIVHCMTVNCETAIRIQFE